MSDEMFITTKERFNSLKTTNSQLQDIIDSQLQEIETLKHRLEGLTEETHWKAKYYSLMIKTNKRQEEVDIDSLRTCAGHTCYRKTETNPNYVYADGWNGLLDHIKEQGWRIVK